jgi:methionyl-tRNA formyltransferase
MTEIKTVFMGSPEFAVPALKKLGEQYPIVGCVTQPDRRAGRGKTLVSPPVKIAADEMGIPTIQPAKLRAPEALDQLREWAPDLIVVAAYGQILRKDVLDLPRYGCINVHASLLPRWRGAAPINAAILHGDAETGITIMQIDEGLDTGDMILKRAIPILPNETAETLHDKLSELGGDLLLEAIPRYLSGDLVAQPQPEEDMTYFGMMKKSDGKLDFTKTALELERQVRAFYPWPGSFMDFNGAPLKVHRTSTAPRNERVPGTRLIQDNIPAVATSAGILILEEVQPAGKKRQSGRDFLNGTRDWES